MNTRTTVDSIALLQTLLERAESERNNALAVLRQAEAVHAQAQAQAQHLHTYRQEFDQRWTLRFQQAGARELLDCRHNFGERLGQAISGQQQAVDSHDKRMRLAREALLAREQRVAAVRKLIERRAAELGRLAERRDQRANDETAQRQHQRRHPTPP